MEYLLDIKSKTNITYMQLLKWIGITSSKFYDWLEKDDLYAEHSFKSLRKHWVLDWEKQAIIDYAKKHTYTGYRRLCY